MLNDKIPELANRFRGLILSAASSVLRFYQPPIGYRHLAQVMSGPELSAGAALPSYNENTMVVWPNNAAEEAASTEEENFDA